MGRGCVIREDGIDGEGMQKRERSRNDLRKLLDDRPVVARKVQRPHLSAIGREQRHGADGSLAIDDYFQLGALRSF